MIKAIASAYKEKLASSRWWRAHESMARLAEELDNGMADDPMRFPRAFAINPLPAAYLWMAVEAGCSMLVVSSDRASNAAALGFLSMFMQDVYTVASVQKAGSDMLLANSIANVTSFYGKSGGKRRKEAMILEAARNAGRIVLDEVTGPEADSLLICAMNDVPFISSVARDGHASVLGSLARELRLDRARLNRLDISLHLFPGEPGSCSAIEYNWLSRAETERGERFGSCDSVSVYWSMSNGTLSRQSHPCLKAVNMYAKARSIPVAEAMSELEIRAGLLHGVMHAPTREAVEAVRTHIPEF